MSVLLYNHSVLFRFILKPCFPCIKRFQKISLIVKWSYHVLFIYSAWLDFYGWHAFYLFHFHSRMPFNDRPRSSKPFSQSWFIRPLLFFTCTIKLVCYEELDVILNCFLKFSSCLIFIYKKEVRFLYSDERKYDYMGKWPCSSNAFDCFYAFCTNAMFNQQ